METSDARKRREERHYQCMECGCPLQPMPNGGTLLEGIAAHYERIHPEIAFKQ